MTNISKDLLPLCLPIEKLVPLQNNPRKGNVDAIMSSYKEFGQIKPIVVRPEKDGTYLVIAGNHQLKAAINLGWTKIAAVQMDVDEERAVAFALADNRTMELGHTDTAMLNDLVIDLWDEYPELFEGLGWDEFELAAIEESQLKSEEISPLADGYFTPVMTNNIPAPPAPTNIRIEESEDGERKIFANEDMDHNKVAVSGSTLVSPGSAPQAVVQYTIVFDNPDQQRRWYDFVRYLRNDPGISGTTTAEKLIDFIDMHTEV